MAQTTIQNANKFIKDHEPTCFTLLTYDSREYDQYDSDETYFQTMAQKESLLKQAFLLIREMLFHYELAQVNVTAEIEELKNQNKQVNEMHINLSTELKEIIEQYREKERSYEKEMLQSNEQIERLLILKEQKELQARALRLDLGQLAEMLNARLAMHDQAVKKLELQSQQCIELENSNLLKNQQLSIYISKYEKISLQFREFQQEMVMLQIENRQLQEEIIRLQNQFQNLKSEQQVFEVIKFNRGTTAKKGSQQKENLASLNIVSVKESFQYSELKSPKNKNISTLNTKQRFADQTSKSKSRQYLNQAYLLKSSQNGTSERQAFNIEDRLHQYLSPVRQTQITAFESGKQLSAELTDNPYYCFFHLLTQCSKINSRHIELASTLDLSYVWDLILKENLPLNLWEKRIQKQINVKAQAAPKDSKRKL